MQFRKAMANNSGPLIGDRGRSFDDPQRLSVPSDERTNSRTKMNDSRLSSPSGPGAMMVGPNFCVGKKIGSGNFGEIRMGELFVLVYVFY